MENVVANGTIVPEVVDSSNMEIVSVDNGDIEELTEELTAGQAVLGTAIIGGVSIALWEGGKWLWRKAIRPAAIKLGEKAKSSLEKEKEEKRKKASEDVVEGVEVKE